MLLNQILEATETFTDEEIELLIGVLYKRRIESRREDIAHNAQEAIAAFYRGELKTVSASDLLAKLHASLEKGEE